MHIDGSPLDGNPLHLAKFEGILYYALPDVLNLEPNDQLDTAQKKSQAVRAKSAR